MSTELSYEDTGRELLFTWEGGPYIEICTRTPVPGAEVEGHPGWYVGTEVINVGSPEERTAPFTQETLETTARDWLAEGREARP